MKKQKLVLALGASAVASTNLLAVNSSERYVYDVSGNIIEKKIGNSVTHYEYQGNRLLKEIGKNGTTLFVNDATGRLSKKVINNGAQVENLYGFSDRLIEVTSEEGITELFYNASGDLVGKTNGSDSETFIWDGYALAARNDGAFTNEGHVVGGVPVFFDGKVFVNEASGATCSVGEIDCEVTAFGESLNEHVVKGLKFMTGKPYLEELGGFVYPARFYTPETGRWMTQDPLGFPDGRNQYSFVLNDPINHIDPMGTCLLYTSPSPRD